MRVFELMRGAAHCAIAPSPKPRSIWSAPSSVAPSAPFPTSSKRLRGYLSDLVKNAQSDPLVVTISKLASFWYIGASLPHLWPRRIWHAVKVQMIRCYLHRPLPDQFLSYCRSMFLMSVLTLLVLSIWHQPDDTNIICVHGRLMFRLSVGLKTELWLAIASVNCVWVWYPRENRR